MYLDRFDNAREYRQKAIHLADRKTVNQTLFSSFQNVLVLQKQWQRRERRQSIIRD